MPTLPPLNIARDRLDEIEEKLFGKNIEFIRFEQTDTHGISRSKTVPMRHMRHFGLKGLNFLLGQLGFDAQAGVAPGTGYLEERGFPDSRVYPDPATFPARPWPDSTAPLNSDPRFYYRQPAAPPSR